MPFDHLLSPLERGRLRLPNRVALTALTRNRAGDGEAPTALNAAYYAQRAGGALIVTEGTQPSAVGQGYPHTPGCHTPEQAEGWKLVTDAVHARGGTIFLQLMHCGRISHPAVLGEVGGGVPVAPSAVTPAGEQFTEQGMQPYVQPRPLTTEEVGATVADYAASARLAVDAAGFDGVEVHGANGYLPAQFLATGSNRREDAYGGSIQGRARFHLEVTHAVAEAIGADRTALRLSPDNPFNDIAEEQPREHFEAVVDGVADLNLAYLAVVEPAEDRGWSAVDVARERFAGVLAANNGFSRSWSFAEMDAMIAGGRADLVMVGRRFLANPDLPDRIRVGASLNEPDQATFYGGGAEGYTDYPPLEAVPAA